jgi:SAM-dependent methyltransferase
MADLTRFAAGSFDLVVHPVSNIFVPDVKVVWRECHRVLRPGGELLAGFMNPMTYLFNDDETEKTGVLTVRYSLPYSDLASLPPAELQARIERCEPLEFGHSLDDQIGGQIEAGLVITGFFEDRWFDDTWLLSTRSPVAMATRALKTG